MAEVNNMNVDLRMVANGVLAEVPISDEELEAIITTASGAVPFTTEWFPPLGGGVPARPQDNPFRQPAPVVPRTSRLTTKEFRKLYEGVAFAQWWYKAPMTAHVVIVWEMMGVEPRRGSKLLGQYLNLAQKWARHRGRSRIGWDLHYIFVHENTPGRGFHSHVLMNIEDFHRKDFEKWSRKCISRLTKRHMPFDAFRLIYRRQKTMQAAVQRSWGWFRYLTKEFDDGWSFPVRDETGQHDWKPLRTVFRLFRANTAFPIPKMKLCGASHSVGRTAQTRTGFQSQFWSGQTTIPYQELFGGQELEQMIKSLQI